MRILLLIFQLLISYALLAQNFQLDILEGDGSGTFLKGDSVHVWADKTSAFEVFINWSGNGAQYLLKDDEWHTVMIVPQNVSTDNFSLVANFDTLKNVSIGQWDLLQWGELEENGNFIPTQKIVEYAYPENPKAIVFFIHGTGGNAGSWFSRFERLTIVKDFVYNGYAVFALNSNETTLGDQDGDGKIRWENNFLKQDSSTNIDFKNVLHTRDFVFDQFNVSTLPVFMLGGSNGANFSDYAAGLLDFKASAHLTGNGLKAYFENYSNLKPVIWVQSINDNNASADSTAARSYYQQLLDKGIATEWHWLERSPAYPKRFMRSLNGIGASLSTRLYDSLNSQGFLNPEGYLNIQNVNADFPFDDFSNALNLSNVQEGDFSDQLNVLNADHIANGDFNKTIIRFFDECLLISSNQSELLDSSFEPKFYPNPVDKNMVIDIKGLKDCQWVITDQAGRLVKAGDCLDLPFKINVENLKAGMYYLSIKKKEQVLSTQQIIKI